MFKRKSPSQTFPFQDPSLSFEQRAKDIVIRLSLKEKIAQMMSNAPGIKHLGILPYHWWNECLHGVGRAGIATVFPQSIGLGATFNTSLINQIGQVISDEARAKHHQAQRDQDYRIYKGLTFWTPNINIFRDPRWGRGQETYGEDPYLTGRMGVALIQGLQGSDPKYLKVAACAKHYVVHSGPEKDRHKFNAIANPKDLRETYLPHFMEAVKEAKVESVMGAYNRTNGEPCCGSPTFLQKILRDEWGFNGHVVSDCGAILDFHWNHKITKNAAESAAMAVKNGCDLNCGTTYKALKAAVRKKLITEAEIDRAVTRLMMTRLKLGMFDPVGSIPYHHIPISLNDRPEHRQLAKKAALESIVLLKNQNNLLPLSKNAMKIAVIGPNANEIEVMLGNYHGTPSKAVTPFEGIQQWVKNYGSPISTVMYAKGCDITGVSKSGFEEAKLLANKSDVVIMVLGINNHLEGEQGELNRRGDREELGLPKIQQALLEEIYAIGKPIVLVLMNGSPVSIPWVQDHIPAILDAWYPGEEGGTAIAEVIFGEYSPAGRLPITVVTSENDLPPIEDYAMEGRTYRYCRKIPLYPFGYGLSYSHFKYSEIKCDKKSFKSEDEVKISVNLTNEGPCSSDEVIQLYIKDVEASVPVPHFSLQRFERIHLSPKESKLIQFSLHAKDFSLINQMGERVLEPGQFEIYVGGSQPDSRSKELTGQTPLQITVEYQGDMKKIPY
jgi:beta-glucosidase